MLHQMGQIFHGMKLLRLCGSGAYGDVYLAEDVSGRRLAVKIVSKKKIGDGWERELKGVINYRKITEDHPELLQIYHVEEDEESFFYTMEPADSVGEAEYKPDTLAERLQNGALPEADLFRILSEIFAEIRLIHEAGFAHRDIKPDNILFVKGKPKLGDIGLMSSLTTTMTQLAGTLDFLPPEQRLGTGKYDKISRQKSDLYAFGKVIYCSVTGASPQDFPSLPRSLSHSLSSKLFLHLAFQLCDSDPARRVENIREITASFADIERKLIYGETAKDRFQLLWKNTGLFFRVMHQHTIEGVKKHYLLVSGTALALGLTGYYTIRHFLSKTDAETEAVVQEVKKQKSAELNLYVFCNERYTLDVPKDWAIHDRVKILTELLQKLKSKGIKKLVIDNQLKLLRHTQGRIVPNEADSSILITSIPLGQAELDQIPDSAMNTVLQSSFQSNARLVKVQRGVKHQNKMDALLAVGTFGADGTVIGYLFPQKTQTIAVTLYRKGNLSVDLRAKFIVMADSFSYANKGKPFTQDADGRTPFMLAIAERDFTEAERLLKAGAKIDETVYGGSTALHLAILDGQLDTVSFLLKHGANVNAADELEMTPLQRTSFQGNTEILKTLLSAGAKLELRDFAGKTALSLAVERGHADCVKLLLDAGANPNITFNGDLKTPLIMSAVVQNDPEILKQLIQHKIDLNMLNSSKENALLRVLAIRLKNKNPAKIELAKILIEAGINVNQQDHVGQTALMYAAYLGDSELVSLLLKHGAKKDLQDGRERTAADLVNTQKYPEVKKLLESL